MGDNYFEFMNRSRFELDAVWLKRVNKIEEDVPLQNVDVIINNLEKEIEKGKIRKIYALKGYAITYGKRITVKKILILTNRCRRFLTCGAICSR